MVKKNIIGKTDVIQLGKCAFFNFKTGNCDKDGLSAFVLHCGYCQMMVNSPFLPLDENTPVIVKNSPVEIIKSRKIIDKTLKNSDKPPITSLNSPMELFLRKSKKK